MKSTSVITPSDTENMQDSLIKTCAATFDQQKVQYAIMLLFQLFQTCSEAFQASMY